MMLNWKNPFSKTYLVLFIVLISIGVGSAYAGVVNTITLAGIVETTNDVTVGDDLMVTGVTNANGGFSCNGCISSGDIGTSQVNALEISPNAVGSSELSMGIFSFSVVNSGPNGSEAVQMVPNNGKNFCFLTQVEVEETDLVGEAAGCQITHPAGNWFLGANLKDPGQNASVSCNAECVVWGPIV